MNEHVYILPSMPVFVQFGFPSPTPNLHETNTTYTCIFVKHASFIDYVNIIHPIN